MAQQYGRWKVIRGLSEGGQAHTYLVSEGGTDDKQLFVLKRLKNPERIRRFKEEVRACVELSHPNILRVVDYDYESQKPYLVSEYLPGGPLSKVDITGYPLVERLRMFSEICRAVGHAHAHTPTIVHRDLKSEKIFLRSDMKTPVVGDFGICFIDEDGERFTLVDEAVGARRFTAPELEDGRVDEIGPASDVYSLGKMLYWMLAGKVFDREKHREARFDLTQGATEPSTHFVYDVLDKTILLDASKRLPNARAVADDVDEVIKKILMKAHPLDLEAPQQCLYCGVGMYKKRVETDISNPIPASNMLNNSGFRFINNQRWLILICDNCGNSQIFVRNFPTNDKWKT
jgi:serine/threonine protein kinase